MRWAASARYVPERQPAGRRSPESRGRGAISHEQLLAGVRLWWSWLKAGLYDGAGREVAVQRLPLHALSPQPCWVERDMTELWQQCGSVISKLLAHTGERLTNPRSGYFRSGKGLFLLDKSDRPLGKAILSSDRRAMEIVQRWQKKRFRKNSTR